MRLHSYNGSGTVPRLLSVCVPTFNRYESLEQTLVNLLAQDYPHLEIVVSDNTQGQSMPASLKLLLSSDQRVKYYHQPRNIGMVANDSFVRAAATGEFLCLVHDDDELPTSYFGPLLDRLNYDNTLSLCGPACDRFYDGRYWYSYRNFSNSRGNQLARLEEIVRDAFRSPWDFEHLVYGVYRRSALPESFRFGPWRSIITFFFLLSIAGGIDTEASVRMRKMNSAEDLAKYAQASYVQRSPIFSRICRSVRHEQRIVLCQRLSYFTLTSPFIPAVDKYRVIRSIVREFFNGQIERGSPSLPSDATIGAS